MLDMTKHRERLISDLESEANRFFGLGKITQAQTEKYLSISEAMKTAAQMLKQDERERRSEKGSLEHLECILGLFGFRGAADV